MRNARTERKGDTWFFLVECGCLLFIFGTYRSFIFKAPLSTTKAPSIYSDINA